MSVVVKKLQMDLLLTPANQSIVVGVGVVASVGVGVGVLPSDSLRRLLTSPQKLQVIVYLVLF